MKAHTKIATPLFTYVNFPGENYLTDKDIFHVSKTLPGIVKYKSIATPLLIQPFDYRISRVAKRILDIFFAIIVLIFILSWLIPVMAVLIKVDSRGPVFFM